MPALLRDRAEAFARTLTKLLNGTVATGARVVAIDIEQANRALVVPAPQSLNHLDSDDLGFVPLAGPHRQAGSDDADLWLKVRYAVSMDDRREHMKVDTSIFASCINRATGFSPLRLEYDRHKTAKQQAHVQVSGDSAGIAYAFAKADRPLKPLHKLHIPVGGRRFRPTLEDFIEFLVQEGLIPSPKAAWRSTLQQTRGDWERRQVGAAVRNHPSAAVDQLVAMGYEVTPPTSSSASPVR